MPGFSSANVLFSNPDKVAKIVAALDLKIPPRDLKSKDTRHLLSLIFNQWLSLSTCVVQAVIDIIPAPPIAQATRIPKMLYPDLYETTLQPKNKLEEDLYASKFAPEACVIAYVSKMFAVNANDLPENKKKPLTTDEMRMKSREAREAREAEPIANELSTLSIVDDAPDDAPDPNKEVLLGFARLYSGTIRVGSSVYAVLPKYNTGLGPTQSSNAKYLLKADVEALYVMMGRELIPVQQVRAGNIFAIKGLESKVWRSATLCSPEENGIAKDLDSVRQKDCLVNLGAVNRTVYFSSIRRSSIFSHL
jgi:ribosome assembly protein 1